MGVGGSNNLDDGIDMEKLMMPAAFVSFNHNVCTGNFIMVVKLCL